ncbi:unnamed protein product [Mytilus coruscus]|uniref:Uncharacterized protein n=1 Tax=Mytilus coruscus TaxID=42192 RepID=A0A6J8A5B8_MYTCO|nr:unnamed protein product [Mytilus coruscus]
MAKSYSCVLCSKTHLTVNNRRTIVNEQLRDYLARTLKRNVESATICLKCRAQVYRDRKTVMNSPQIRQGIATCQSNDDDDPDFLAEETLPLELISPKSIQLNLSSTSKYHRRCTVCQTNSKEDYQRLTGLTRNQFEAVANTDLRISEIRSVKTCLAILLVKLRTGLSNSILATLFSFEIHQIQRATHAARSSLMKSFVPSFLGFQHMSHEKFTRDHTTPTARTLFFR